MCSKRLSEFVLSVLRNVTKLGASPDCRDASFASPSNDDGASRCLSSRRGKLARCAVQAVRVCLYAVSHALRELESLCVCSSFIVRKRVSQSVRN